MRVAVPQAVLLIGVLVGCASPPRPQPPTPTPFYEVQPDLLVKAKAHRLSTLSMLDQDGLYCYRHAGPAAIGSGSAALSNYLYNHDMADAPAWHGMLMQAVAYEEAAGGEPADEILSLMADALLNGFRITGVPGLIGRSWIAGYTGPRAYWMSTSADRPAKFWQQGPTGEWYRNGLAKNHWNMTVSGCGLALHLDRVGKISLSQSTRSKLGEILVAMVSRFVDDGFILTDHEGNPTEFGDMRPGVGLDPDWPELPVPNGFNRIVVLAALKSAGELDAGLKSLYEDMAPAWLPGAEQSMVAVGAAIRAVGHHKLDKPSYSDMQAFATAATVLVLQEQDPEFRSHVLGSLNGLWRFMRYENNVPFVLGRAAASGESYGDRWTEWALECMRAFPGLDGKVAFAFEKQDSSHYQPIQNRPPNNNYWKSSPFRRGFVDVDLAKAERNPETGDLVLLGGADYLYAYWLGRFLQIFPER